MHAPTPAGNARHTSGRRDSRSFPTHDRQGKPAARVVSVSRSIGHALVLSSGAGWRDFQFVISARLTTSERRALAYAALTALTPEDAGEVIGWFADLLPEAQEMVAAAASGAGYPYILPGEEMTSARLWAAEATDRERDAFCLASFEALSPERRAAFLGFTYRGAAA